MAQTAQEAAMKALVVAIAISLAWVLPAAAQNAGVIGSQLGTINNPQPQLPSPCPPGGCASAPNLTPTLPTVPTVQPQPAPPPVAVVPAQGR
jgi:hypothetical protein